MTTTSRDTLALGGNRLIARGLATSTLALLVVFGVQAITAWACGADGCHENVLPTIGLLAGALIAIALTPGLVITRRQAGQARVVLGFQAGVSLALGLGAIVMTALWSGVFIGQEFEGGANVWWGTPLSGMANGLVYSFGAGPKMLWVGTPIAVLSELTLVTAGFLISAVAALGVGLRLGTRVRLNDESILAIRDRLAGKYALVVAGIALLALLTFVLIGAPAISSDAWKLRATSKLAQLIQQREQTLSAANQAYNQSAQTLNDLHSLGFTLAIAYSAFNNGVAEIDFPDSIRGDINQLILTSARSISAARRLTQATSANYSELALDNARDESDQEGAQTVVVRDLRLDTSGPLSLSDAIGLAGVVLTLLSVSIALLAIRQALATIKLSGQANEIAIRSRDQEQARHDLDAYGRVRDALEKLSVAAPMGVTAIGAEAFSTAKRRLAAHLASIRAQELTTCRSLSTKNVTPQDVTIHLDEARSEVSTAIDGALGKFSRETPTG